MFRTVFRTVSLSIIRSLVLYTQQKVKGHTGYADRMFRRKCVELSDVHGDVEHVL